MICANLREISRSFLLESSRLRIFVRGVYAKEELFSWANLYMTKIPSCYGSPGGTIFVITIGTSCLLFITYLLSLITYHLI